ncbi:hypothetical protein AA13755_1979 [Acetobacter peroxydans NBRC 13755]|nr:hypothetical protein [Acetobacter peroxydans]GBR37738.1 hypothetical protein AA13755_1979 [Acetobacter peroxydans NBRC 13755]
MSRHVVPSHGRPVRRNLLLHRSECFLQGALLRLNVGDLLFQCVQIRGAGPTDEAGQAA